MHTVLQSQLGRSEACITNVVFVLFWHQYLAPINFLSMIVIIFYMVYVSAILFRTNDALSQ